MIEIVCACVAKEQVRGQFELVYGPGGAWGTLFGGRAGFRGTTLLRDTQDPSRYLVIELWDGEAEREQALVACKAEYADLDALLDEWTEIRTEVGVYRVLAEATVRPRGSARRSRGETHRRVR